MAALAAAALLLGPAAAVEAHAALVGSDPAPNASLVESPERLELRFSEAIDAGSADVRLLDEQQNQVEGLGEPSAAEGGSVVRLDLPALEPGTYTVSYRVASAVDGHVTQGIFAFLVDPTGREPPPSTGPQSSSPTSDPAGVAARWFGLAGLLGVVGVSLFWLASGLPTLGAVGRGRLGGAWPWLALALFALAGAAGLVVNLALTAAALGAPGVQGGIPFDPAARLGWTPFAIAMRIAVAGGVAAFAIAAGRWVLLDRSRLSADGSGGRALLAVCLALGALGLLGASLAGHASSLGGPLNAAVDWLHLLGVAAWIATLPGLLLFLALTRRLPAGEAGRLRTAMLRRHARVATLAAPVVVITGLANTPLVLGEVRGLVSDAYGNLLLAKAILFSAALAIGAVNFLIGRAGLGGRVAPLVAFELGIGALAVLAGATLVTIQPASSAALELRAPPLTTAHLYGAAGPSAVHLAVNLPEPGPQRYQVSLTDLLTGDPQSGLQRVFLVFTPPAESGLPEQRVDLEPGEPPWVWDAAGAYTPVLGSWTVEVVVRRVGERDGAATFALEVREPIPPEAVPPPVTGLEAPPLLGAAWSLLPRGPAAWLVPAVLLGATGLAAGLEAVRVRRGRAAIGWTSPLRAGLALAAILALAVVGSRSLAEAANAAPPERAAAVNPVPATGESIELGQRLYAANCASCHGIDGRGDGPLVTRPVPLAALTDVVPGRRDGELAWTIANGVAGTEMPAFAGLLTPADRWHLVNYLRLAFGSGE